MNYAKKESFQSELALLRNRERHPYLHTLLAYLRKDGLILDLGCGLLVNSQYLKDNGFHVVGVDISLNMLCTNKSEDVFLLCADGIKLPFKEGSFGGLLLVDILEHLPRGKVTEFLAEVKRVLKESGIIFLHVPLEKSWIYRLLNTLKVIWPKNPNHLHDYNLKQVIGIIKQNNYRVLWDHRENGIAYSLHHHLKRSTLSRMVNNLLGRCLQNIFTASYTAFLSLRSNDER